MQTNPLFVATLARFGPRRATCLRRVRAVSAPNTLDPGRSHDTSRPQGASTTATTGVPRMRLLTCSSSGPAVTHGPGVQQPSVPPGGLVPILSALLEEVGGRWIFAAPSGSDPIFDRSGIRAGETAFWHPLRLPAMEAQRRTMSVGVFLWLFHYLHDTSLAPIFNADTKSAWLVYQDLNQSFADAVVALHVDSNDEVVLINDFHLMLVPGRFSSQAPARKSRLAYFHHVPWCEADYFGILPAVMRTEILTSLLSCDVVGFHCGGWGDAFIACCERYLESVAVVGRVVHYRGHRTVVATAPGPIDAAKLDAIAQQPETNTCRERLLREASGRRIVVRVDRVDLWKNIVRGFAAFEEVLDRDHDLASDVWFCAIVSPPRFPTVRHDRYQAACEAAARKVNDRYGRARDVITMIYPELSGSDRRRAVAALQVGSASVVNPTYDGLNLVAKESLVVNPHAPLVLSTNAGAYSQVASAAIPIHPYDVDETADAIAHAIRDGRDEASQGARDACAASLRQESGARWLHALIDGDRPSQSGRLPASDSSVWHP
jgi:trehalose 6-phosphate synthase